MNLSRTITILLIFCSLASLLIASCNSTDSSNKQGQDQISANQTSEIRIYNDSLIAEARHVIKPGDLVLRTGTDYSSDQVKELSLQDKTYSHGGIALSDSNGIFIYHVEPDYYYVNDKVRKENLDSFCNPVKNYGFAIARYGLSETEVKDFLGYLESQYQQKIPFDMGFRLETDDKMYCSEMIRKGLSKVTDGRIIIGTIKLTDKRKFKEIRRHFKLKDNEIMNREIVPIDLLFLNPNCQLIKQYKFLPSS